MTTHHAPHPDAEEGLLAAKDRPRVVGGIASSHVRDSLYHQRRLAHARDGGGTVAATTAALLRHRDAFVWTRWWDHRSDRGGTTA
jgi:hypothetical protein